MSDVIILYLPSPPRINVFRDWAGGYGTALPSKREYPGHDQVYFDVPCLQSLYIARQLQQKGLAVAYTDLQRQERFDFSELEQLLDKGQSPILLTNVSLPSLDHDIALLRKIKAQFPLTIVLAGMIARLFRDKILQEGAADYILMEQEEVLAPYVIESILQGNPQPAGAFFLEEHIVTGRPSPLTMTDLNDVDFPAYDLLDFNRYESTYPFNQRMRYMTLLTSRGCPYPCTYCPYPIGFGKKVLYRAPHLVLADIERLVNEFQVELLVFRDQLLTLNRAHCEAIFQGMIDKHWPVQWLCETRYDLVDPKLLALMAKAGCREINYGLESGDETLFHSVAKAQARKGLDYFGEMIQATKAVGIRCHTHLMLGLPDDSWPSIRRTVRFLKKQKPDSVQVAIFIPYPGTPLGEQLKAEGKVQNLDYSNYTGFKAVIPTKYLSVEEVDEARGYIYNVWNQTLFQRGVNKIKHLLAKV